MKVRLPARDVPTGTDIPAGRLPVAANSAAFALAGGIALLALVGAGGLVLAELPRSALVLPWLFKWATPEHAPWIIWALAEPGTAIVVFPVSLAAAVASWRRRGMLVSLTCVAAPIVASVVTEVLLKHLFAGTHQSYPSGHTTAATAMVGVVVMAAGPRYRRMAVSVGLVVAAGVVVAVVVLGFHSVVSSVAGVAAGAGWVLVIAAVLTLITTREYGRPGATRH